MHETNHASSFSLVRTGMHFLFILLVATLIIFNLTPSALAAHPNNSMGVSDNGIYYTHDKSSKLKPVTPSGVEAESFAFCINNKKGTPSYSGGSNTGEYTRTENASANDIYAEWLHNRGASSSNSINSAQLDDVLRKLIYIYVVDPTDTEGSSGLRDINPNGFAFYTVIQNVIYHYTDNQKHTTYVVPQQAAALRMVRDMLERPIGEVIPQNVDVKVNLYKAQPARPSQRVQSLISGRVVVRPIIVHLSKKQ
ncbi:MAG: thioester-forming surface-anchored protein [Winkia sp. UMB750A]|uniref:thioester-forming surface-anchored protein n=1 Tax=unclassified Winkia TaxID=2692119 RepID=UPI002556E055|nr:MULTISPECIES: thioester-forming surface-anchored protein [unclassified Winkia]MDK8225085.1 thioester-forming surface-anchored protein [Winkia sp. UMB750B]MDK8256539.1 thioester-forming surface-anchored protein [Winkia sp. UMB750A]